MKIKYYTLKNILAKDARYNIIFGERSNGKTYAVLNYGIEQFIATGKKIAIVRRYEDDFRSKRGASMFEGLVSNGVITKLTGGEWNDITYYSGRWYFSRYDEDIAKRVTDAEPFAYAFSLSSMEHDKSTSYPDITTILFDEFLTRTRYMTDEFVIFMNVLSTIIRMRNDVKIFMLGNTVNQYCPYFVEMGLKHIKEMKKGDIDVYTYGDSGLRVAVEYADNPNKGKPSDVYFAFNNPKLHMITGGAWEFDIYPHKPFDFTPADIKFKYFIKFDGEMLQCEIVKYKKSWITYIHRKTGDLKQPDKDLIYTTENDPRPNWRKKITKPTSELEKKIASFYMKDKVFYQDNEVGEIIRNYLLWCGKTA